MKRSLFHILCVLLCFGPSAGTAQAQVGERALVQQRINAIHKGLSTEAATALRDIEEVLALPQVNGDALLRSSALWVRGDILRTLGRYDQAMADLVRAHAVADSLGNDSLRVHALVTMASAHLDMNEPAMARTELQEAMRAVGNGGHPKLAKIHLDKGVLFDIEGKADSALHHYLIAERLALVDRDSATLATVYHDLGVLYAYQDDAANSERYELKALEMLPRHTPHDLRAKILISLGSYYAHLGLYDKALPMLEQCRKEAIASGAGQVLRAYHQVMSALYRQRGDTARVFEQLNRMMEVRDSLEANYRTQALADAEARFGLARVEKELALSRAEAEASALRAQRARIAWGALLIIAALAVVLVISYYRQVQLKRQAASALERDRERLSEENELLHQENLMARFETLKSQIDPHFLFNAMNTLYTLVEVEPAKAREFIASFSALYRKVLGSRDRTIVPIAEELELIRHYLFLQRIRFGDSLLVNVDVSSTAKGYLPPFTLQMLLENAIKHNVISAARPLRIDVTVQGDRILVRNDLRVRGTSAAGTGTGIENIRRRYAMLGAPEPRFTMTATHYEASVPLMTHEP